MLKKEPPCGPCPKPELVPENHDAWETYHLVSGQQIWAGMGSAVGVSFPALGFVFETMGVPVSARREIFEKILVIDRVSVKKRMAKEKQDSAAAGATQAQPQRYRKGGK